MICDQCETVAHCMKNGCVPKTTVQQDIPDLIAGALGVSRGTAYDMMREALAEQPAQQEPVAWQWKTTMNFLKTVPANAEAGIWRPVYTSPPAQRTWVGLTDEELRQVWYDDAPVEGGTYIDKLRQVEAKLKEKNT